MYEALIIGRMSAHQYQTCEIKEEGGAEAQGRPSAVDTVKATTLKIFNSGMIKYMSVSIQVRLHVYGTPLSDYSVYSRYVTVL